MLCGPLMALDMHAVVRLKGYMASAGASTTYIKISLHTLIMKQHADMQGADCYHVTAGPISSAAQVTWVT
jgi:hypothetical protein